jgi:hypothetical protein
MTTETPSKKRDQIGELIAPMKLSSSLVLLIGGAVVIIVLVAAVALGFADGKIDSMSIRINHPLPDFELQINTPSSATANRKTPLNNTPASGRPKARNPQPSRSDKAGLRAAGTLADSSARADDLSEK